MKQIFCDAANGIEMGRLCTVCVLGVSMNVIKNFSMSSYHITEIWNEWLGVVTVLNCDDPRWPR